MKIKCDMCNGTGVIWQQCSTCNGQGFFSGISPIDGKPYMNPCYDEACRGYGGWDRVCLKCSGSGEIDASEAYKK